MSAVHAVLQIRGGRLFNTARSDQQAASSAPPVLIPSLVRNKCRLAHHDPLADVPVARGGGIYNAQGSLLVVDGGSVTVPFFRFYTPEGEYRIEYEGVAPDYRVELDQLALDEGRDTQLEAAIGYILTELDKTAPETILDAPAPPTQLGL